jgi:hypothetical protein
MLRRPGRATVGAMFTATWFKDTLERTIKTALQAFLAVIILSGDYHLTAVRAAVIAGLAAAFTVVKAAIAPLLPGLKITPASWAAGPVRTLLDIGERLIFTFAEVGIALIVKNGDYHLSTLRDAALAGLAAALSLVMSLLSTGMPAISPASLVTGVRSSSVTPARR